MRGGEDDTFGGNASVLKVVLIYSAAVLGIVCVDHTIFLAISRSPVVSNQGLQ